MTRRPCCRTSDRIKELIGVFGTYLGVTVGFFGVLVTLIGIRRR